MIYTCLHCEAEFEAKRPAKFCCAAHRAAWHKQNAGTIPATVQSANPTADGALVVVVRVPADFKDRAGRLLPRTPVDLLERPSDGESK